MGGGDGTREGKGKRKERSERSRIKEKKRIKQGKGRERGGVCFKIHSESRWVSKSNGAGRENCVLRVSLRQLLAAPISYTCTICSRTFSPIADCK